MNSSVLRHFAIRSRNVMLQVFSSCTETPENTEHSAQLWFMRLTALRFMEINGYLSKKMPKTVSGITALCRRLSDTPALAGLFGEEVALPEELLSKWNGFLSMLHAIPEEEWLDFPEVLGWLYQYWNTEEKDRTFAKLRGNVKIPAEQIPAATQTFTPDWIVRYMTENALSALCRPHERWRYVIPEASQPAGAAAEKYAGTTPAFLRIIDPCMGTGHILAYVFDALMDLYCREETAPSEAAVRILTDNLYGLDIDKNACSLASFVLLMKARKYDTEILQKDIRIHLYHFAGLDIPGEEFPEKYRCLSDQFANAHVFGSLLRPEEHVFKECPAVIDRMQRIAGVLNRKYDCVITNPPYMGSSNMNPVLSAFVRTNYPDSRWDLFAAFMERCALLTASHGCFAMITQHSWMFLSSYKRLRRNMKAYTMRSMVHLGAKAFSQMDVGTIVQTTAFVCMGRQVPGYRTTYLRLTEDEDKETAFFEENRRCVCDIERLSGIPGEPLCYWISDRMLRVLQEEKLSGYCKICQGMTTSDNKRFVRYWHEVTPGSIAFGCENAQAAMASGKRWFPYNKGGKFRKWYGNNSYVVNFYRNGEEMRIFHAKLNKEHAGGRIKNETMYFRQAVTWPFISASTRFGVRLQPEGFLFDVSGSSLFPDAADTYYLMGFLCSKVALEILRLYNPTLNFQVENISSLPIIIDEAQKSIAEQLVLENIAIAREEWDCYEQSWAFTCHPLVQEGAVRISEAFAVWEEHCRRRTQRMQENEHRLNEIFIRIYGLEGELSPEVSEQEITLRNADVQRDVRSLLGFAIGCIFGRYRVEHAQIPMIPENFLPLSPEDGKDAVQYLEEFLTAVYGRETLAENLQYIARSLGGEGDARKVIRRYFATEFYLDHCRIYRKRPVYWMADSGRRHGCRGLMYLHRMDEDFYPLLEQHAKAQSIRYAREIRLLEKQIGRETQKSAAAQLRHDLVMLEKKAAEVSGFQQNLAQLRHSGARMNPDDGVLVNYKRFQRILAAIY